MGVHDRPASMKMLLLQASVQISFKSSHGTAAFSLLTEKVHEGPLPLGLVE